MNTESVSKKPEGNAINTLLCPVFPCKVKIDGDIYTSQDVCTAFKFNHTDFMFKTALAIIESKYGKVER